MRTIFSVMVAVALCAIAVLVGEAIRRVRESRAVAVRLKRCDDGLAATFTPPRRRSIEVVEHSTMFLSESGNGGDGLLRSDNATLDSSMTVRFIDHTPGQRMEFDRGADRVRPLLPGQGGAAWIRYRSMRPNASDPVVLVLWEAPNRAKGMRPKVLRGARADQWIRHISTADAPVPTPLLSRIWTAVTPGWLADPQIRPAVNVVSAVFGAVLLLVAALVAMDLSGLRSVLPLTVEYDWLGFAGGLMGGVAGGVMTLAGVMLTLRSSGRAERLPAETTHQVRREQLNTLST